MDRVLRLSRRTPVSCSNLANCLLIAERVIDYRKEDIVHRVKEITNDRGVDLTLNPITGETLKSDLDALGPLGTAVLFGFLAGPPAGSFAEDLAKHFNKSVAVRVSDIYTYFVNNPGGFNADMARVYSLLVAGDLRPQIQILPIDQAAEAHRRLEASATTGKLVPAMVRRHVERTNARRSGTCCA